MEKAVELLHRTKEAPTDEKAAHFEQFLRLIRGVNAAPGFFEELLPLITDELMGEDTRHFVPQFVEEACRRQKGLIPMCTAAISELSKDENPVVLSKVMRATGVLFRKALLAICSDDGDVAEEDQADMWQAVREAAMTLMQHSNHEHAHVRNSAVMLLQVLGNILSAPSDVDGADGEEEDAPDSAFSLHSIPPCHQFLDYSELKGLGQECVRKLLDILDVEKWTGGAIDWQTMSVAIHSLGRVARHNPHLIGTIEPALTSCCSSHMSKELKLAKWEAASIRSTVKSTLLALLKLPRCAAYAAVLVERLSSLGAVTQAEAARRTMDKARMQYGRGAAHKKKRQLDPRVADAADAADSAKRARLPEPPLVDIKRIPPDKGPEQWPPDLVSELILAAMKKYPPALPPHLIDVADAPLHMWPERLAHPGQHAKLPLADAAEKADEGGGAESSQTVAAIRNKALMSAKPLNKGVIQALSHDALLRLLKAEAAGWAARTAVVARLVASSIVATTNAPDEVLERELVTHVLENYGERHGLATEYLHHLLIQDTAQRPRGAPRHLPHHAEKEKITITAKVEKDDAGGAKVQAGSSIEKGAKGAGEGAGERPPPLLPERYKKVLLMLVEGLIKVPCSEDETAKLLTRLLADAPAIDEATMRAVSALCDDEKEEVRKVGLSCLRALIQHHQAWRRECLARLLKYTVARDQAVRLPAVRQIYNKLFALTYLCKHIEDFAVGNLRKACRLSPLASHDSTLPTPQAHLQHAHPGVPNVPVSEGGAGAEEGVVVEVFRQYMHLFVALCVKRHSLLHALVHTYVEASPPVRSAVQACITDMNMIKLIGAESPVLLAIITDLPAGAELLLLTFVRTLTDTGNPAQHKKLLEAIKALYVRNSDARFMIYVCAALSRSEVEELLPRLVACAPSWWKAALHRLLHSRTSAVTPENLMVSLHKLTPSGTLTMKKIVDAIELCFNDRAVFTTQVLAVVLQRLLDQNPLPELYMRTVMMALKASPTLTDFVMGILQRLISKQVWTMAILWKGFVKCCRQTLPRSLAVLVQLPPQHLQKAVQECQELGQPLALYLKDQLARGYNVLPAHCKIVEPWIQGAHIAMAQDDCDSDGGRDAV